MKGIILSHTRMGATNSGFCTNILVEDGNGNPIQIRPRSLPNNNLFICSFGMNENQMMKKWRPGCWVRLPKFKYVVGEYRRPTHPEDVILDHYEGVEVDFEKIVKKSSYIELIEPFCYRGIDELFPDVRIKRGSFNKWYVPGGLNLNHSVGYIYSKEVKIYVDFDKFRARITDENGNIINGPLKDEHLLRKLKKKKEKIQQKSLIYKNKLLRLSLANPWNEGNRMGESRCFVMVSHIVK
ncbi:MAG: hypothetical protein GF349_01770 [Candidatus Magasanikbacteria bacterium]|nr:hypothetical protein [Candidatus Magasanikbacteria bacterium]